MAQPAAKQGDQVTGTDIHIEMVPAAAGAPVPTPMPHPFSWAISDDVSSNVTVNRQPAATVGSVAQGVPHIPIAGPFQKPPSNRGQVQIGSTRVTINGKAAARNGDPVITCNDPVDAPNGTIIATSTVFIGG